VRVEHALAVCLLKNTKYNMKNIKTPLMVLLITQNIRVKISKYPQRKNFFFVFLETKIVICLYLKIRKTWLLLWKKVKETFIHLKKIKNKK
jgi:hypothetical protein